MSKKSLEQNKRDFCGIYLDTLDAQRAAERVGGGDGYEMLQQKDVRHYLKQARKNVRQSVQMEDVLRRLCQIAFSRPNDALALACGSTERRIEELDLMAVSEFKYKEEAAEVKFLDRVRALQVLGELLNATEEQENGAAQDFFESLEQFAREGSGETVP